MRKTVTYKYYEICMRSFGGGVLKMKIPRTRLIQMETNVQKSMDAVKTLELFSDIPLEPTLEYDKPPPDSVTKGTVENSENFADKKRKQRKKRVLTGVSRQRRAANDRERRRNVRLNQAFVTLKKTLPLSNIDISKIEILRLAVKWIDHLATLLKDHEHQNDLLTLRQTSKLNENGFYEMIGKSKPVRHDCLYHEDPDLKNTLWEDCIGLPKRSCDDNDGCIHIKSNSRFHELFS